MSFAGSPGTHRHFPALQSFYPPCFPVFCIYNKSFRIPLPDCWLYRYFHSFFHHSAAKYGTFFYCNFVYTFSIQICLCFYNKISIKKYPVWCRWTTSVPAFYRIFYFIDLQIYVCALCALPVPFKALCRNAYQLFLPRVTSTLFNTYSLPSWW